MVKFPSKGDDLDLRGPADGAPVLTPRFIVSLVLMIAGVAWMAYYYVAVQPDGPNGNPAFMADLGRWNYLIGFVTLMVGLVVAADKRTPLGRGRGVVAGMLGCFLVGLLWICIYYVFSNDISRVPFFDDLGQYNLIVGIGFMAVGFTFATKWE